MGRSARFHGTRVGRLGVPVLLAAVMGCAGKGPVREVTPRDVLARAEAKIEDGDHLEAVEILTQLTVDHPGVAFIDRVVFQLGRAHLEAGEYAQSEAQFLRLGRDYPFSEFADDAAFLIAEGFFRQRGNPSVDPRNAEHARDAIRRFLREYPESDLAPAARTNMQVLYEFFAKKKYDNARQYQRLGRPASAVIYFEKVFAEYPDSDVAPDALLELAKTYRQMGETPKACRTLALLRDLPASDALDVALAKSVHFESEWRCHETTADGTVGAEG
jgi:outer membrane protein assembly factor BamD